MRVLYIGGAGRSGSTLLESLLGNAEGVFSAGEVRYFWEYMSEGRSRCGCGEPLAECPVWSAVAQRIGDVDIQHTARIAARIDRTRRTPLLMLGGSGSMVNELAESTRRLYLALAEVTDAELIVDSSKVPSHLVLLTRMGDATVSLVHLVRDGRAVAYSWSHRLKRESRYIDGDGYMAYRSSLRAMATWLVENLLICLAARKVPARLLLRYEDFVAEPAARLSGLASQLGLEDRRLPTIDSDGRTRLAPTHSVGGNPVRFSGPERQIKADESWRESMEPWRRRCLSIAGLPMLRHFGYPLWI